MEGAAQEARLDQPMERNDVRHDSFLIRGDPKSAAAGPQDGGDVLPSSTGQTDRQNGRRRIGAQLKPPSGPNTIQFNLIRRFGSD